MRIEDRGIGVLTPIKFLRYGTVKLPQGRQLVRECVAFTAHTKLGGHDDARGLHLRAIRLFTRAAAVAMVADLLFIGQMMAMSYRNFLRQLSLRHRGMRST